MTEKKKKKRKIKKNNETKKTVIKDGENQWKNERVREEAREGERYQSWPEVIHNQWNKTNFPSYNAFLFLSLFLYLFSLFPHGMPQRYHQICFHSPKSSSFCRSQCIFRYFQSETTSRSRRREGEKEKKRKKVIVKCKKHKVNKKWK